MFNPQARAPERSTRLLVFQQSLEAALKSHRHNLPSAPASLPSLLAGCQIGTRGLLGRPGCRDALGEIRARLFHTPGRDVEAHAWWSESVASAVFASRVAHLLGASVAPSFLGALLHQSGEALALKILARVELDYRMKLDSSSRRDWCSTHAADLSERLVRTWKLPEEIETCLLSRMRVVELDTLSQECKAVYFGRLFAIEFLQPEVCVPGALDHAAGDLGLSADLVAQVRQEDVRSLMRALE